MRDAGTVSRIRYWAATVELENIAADLVARAKQCGLVLERSGPRGDGVPVLALLPPTSEAAACAIRELSRQGDAVLALIVGDVSAVDPWALLAAGAVDVLALCRDGDALSALAARVARLYEIENALSSPRVRDNLVGQSPAWLSTVRRAVEAAMFSDAPVLLTGETGTGKELVARLVHTLDSRPNKKDLIIVDCAALVPDLSGSEFFGHERGAFTGAVEARVGALELADGGTLFLDEVGELPLPLQAQLLRAVQEHSYKRVGGSSWRRARFRILAATHRDLRDEVSQGRFREDLFHRLRSLTIHLPPLRERRSDILPLARHFLRKLGRHGTFDPWLEGYLFERSYDGNVRELRQLVTRIAARDPDTEMITVGAIPEEERPLAPLPQPDLQDNPALLRAIELALQRGTGLKAIGRAAEDAAIRIAFGQSGGNLARAARLLGVTDRALQLRRAAKRSDADHGEDAA